MQIRGDLPAVLLMLQDEGGLEKQWPTLVDTALLC